MIVKGKTAALFACFFLISYTQLNYYFAFVGSVVANLNLTADGAQLAPVPNVLITHNRRLDDVAHGMMRTSLSFSQETVDTFASVERNVGYWIRKATFVWLESLFYGAPPRLVEWESLNIPRHSIPKILKKKKPLSPQDFL
jgi:hypothetical protein